MVIHELIEMYVFQSNTVRQSRLLTKHLNNTFHYKTAVHVIHELMCGRRCMHVLCISIVYTSVPVVLEML